MLLHTRTRIPMYETQTAQLVVRKLLGPEASYTPNLPTDIQTLPDNVTP